MTAAWALRWLPIALDATLKTSLLLTLAAIAAFTLRRRSADARRLLWGAALLVSLLLPIVAAFPARPAYVVAFPARPIYPSLLPPLRGGPAPIVSPPAARPGAEIPAASVAETTRPGGHAAPRERRTGSGGLAPLSGQAAIPAFERRHESVSSLRSLPEDLFTLWLFGCILASLETTAGLIGIAAASRCCPRITDGPMAAAAAEAAAAIGLRRRFDFRIGRNGASYPPMTWGAVVPTVLLPAEASAWPPERLRAVLLHELAHVKRSDWLFFMAGRAARALYWFHPFVWGSVRELRLETERAGDDSVLSSGVRATDYARELLEVAKMIRAKRLLARAGLSMAQASQLERRIRSILDPGRARGGLARRGSILVGVAAAATLAALGSVTPAARPETPAPPHAPAAAETVPVPSPAVSPSAVPSSPVAAVETHHAKASAQQAEKAGPVRRISAIRVASRTADKPARRVADLRPKLASEPAALRKKHAQTADLLVRRTLQEVRLKEAAAALDDRETEYRNGMITKADLDAAQAERDRARVMVDATRREIVELQKATRGGDVARAERAVTVKEHESRVRQLEIDRHEAEGALAKDQALYRAGALRKSELDAAQSLRDQIENSLNLQRAYLKGFEEGVQRSGAKTGIGLLDRTPNNGERWLLLQDQLINLKTLERQRERRIADLLAKTKVGIVPSSELAFYYIESARYDLEMQSLQAQIAEIERSGQR